MNNSDEYTEEDVEVAQEQVLNYLEDRGTL